MHKNWYPQNNGEIPERRGSPSSQGPYGVKSGPGPAVSPVGCSGSSRAFPGDVFSQLADGKQGGRQQRDVADGRRFSAALQLDPSLPYPPVPEIVLHQILIVQAGYIGERQAGEAGKDKDIPDQFKPGNREFFLYIHIMKKERVCNTFEGKLLDATHVEFLGCNFECVPVEGIAFDTNVKVEVDFEKVILQDNEEDGTLTGEVKFILYKGDHYHLTVLSDWDEDVFV